MVVDRENANGGPVSAHDSPLLAQTLDGATIERRVSHKRWSLECATQSRSPLLLRSTYRVARRSVGLARASLANPNVRHVPSPAASRQRPFHHPGYAAEEDVRHK